MKEFKLRYKENANTVTPYLDRVNKELKGGRERIFLKEYKFPISPKSAAEKQKVKQCKNFANARLIKENEVILMKSAGYTIYDLKQSFIYFLEEKRDHFINIGSPNTKLDAIIKIIKQYSKGEDVSFEEAKSYIWLKGYKEFLISEYRTKSKKKLATNTASAYLRKVKLYIYEAFKEKKIPDHAINDVDPIKEIGTEKEYLSIDELKLLLEDPTSQTITVRRAFLFCCLTGFRNSDVINMNWDEVKQETIEGQKLNYIYLRLRKSKDMVKVYLNEKVLTFIGYEKENKGLIFEGLKVRDSPKIPEWIKSKGITKHLTFHTSRHTNATLLLSHGADIFTVSQLLGHKNISTTQIYLHTVEKKLVEASTIIPNLLS